MMSEKPTVAIALSVIGGILVLVVGLLLALVGAIATFFVLGVGAIFGLWGVACGIIMIIGGGMMSSRPEEHATWGVLVLIFSVLSLGGLGGLGLGFILGLIGGALGISWKPFVSTSAQPGGVRYCPNCGKAVSPGAGFCPYCGSQVPA
jgi:hypothetical protein